MDKVQPGLEVLLQRKINLVAGLNIGFITNHSSVTANLTSAVDTLIESGVKISAIFAPEHGVRGELADGQEFSESIDPRTGIPIFSLYGKTKKPTPEMLKDLDLLLFDIQDVGARFYTFLYTMALAIEACAEHNKRFVVLDRPNPLGGISVEGPVLEPQFSSFVGMYPIPIRYGLTIGETARLFNHEFGIDADLEVVPLDGWRREMWFDQTGLPWIPPSPAMPSLETAVVYPGTCLIEGTNISEGRGTSLPFQITGAPWINGRTLADKLNQAGLPGVRFRPTHFTPNASKYLNEQCEGIQIHVIDRNSFLPVLTGVKIIEVIQQLWPERFEFRQPDQNGRFFFDLLAGTDRIRLGIQAGMSAEEISSNWEPQINRFISKKEPYLLYN